jgi:flagellar operon protein (TIGR03826 family)
MNVKNCRNCGKIFNYVSGPVICPACRESAEAKFQEVKEYIREHKGVGMSEVAEACDVEIAQIRQWLRDERLEVTADSQMFLTCENCGAHIRSGRFCEKCKSEVERGFKDIASSAHPAAETRQKPETSSNARMHFL